MIANGVRASASQLVGEGTVLYSEKKISFSPRLRQMKRKIQYGGLYEERYHNCGIQAKISRVLRVFLVVW